ncbi:MAG: CMP-binding protein [Clostridiales bacterium]|nr:CMP-binding protein [Clostridiales bacterium]MDY5349340.1 CMP-binding protein [Candidatus Ventricola sp.]MDY5513317.1 CMP-binding protein [Candidatus Ventricola sp.]
MLLSEIRRDDKFEGFLIVRSAEQRAAASGKNYLDMTLADRSGSINAKMWDGTVQPPVAGSIVKVRATGNEFNGRMQLRVEKIRAAENRDGVDMSTLIPCAPEDPKAMLEEIVRAADHIADPDLRRITCELLDRAGSKLLTFPAAKQMHHAERSGLLHHMTTMLKAARAIMTVYPQLNASLLTAGVIVHDLAKIDEMDADALGLVSDYSVDGKLLGHIVRGVVNIELAAQKTGASKGKALLLQHMVLSHHGIPEYGSPLAPKFPEAEVLNAIDTLDARLFEMNEALSRAMPGGFSEKVWGLDNRQLYRIPDEDLTK